MASTLHSSVQCFTPFRTGRTPAPIASKALARSLQIRCDNNSHSKEQPSPLSRGAALFLGLAAAASTMTAPPAFAEARLPPIDRGCRKLILGFDADPNRCERAYVGNTIGQANAVSDKILDLRMCDYTGKNLSGKVLSGALLKDATLPNSILRETVLTKAYAVGSDFSGADLTNAVVDRVDFRKANLKNVIFANAVITGVQFEGANLEGALFEGALIGNEDAKRLCANPTLTDEGRNDVGCRIKK